MTIEDKVAQAAAEVLAIADDAWSAAAEAELASAVAVLEGTSFAQRLSRIVGQTIGQAGGLMPAGLIEAANGAAMKALSGGMRAVLTTLSDGQRPASRGLHLAAVAASGAFGGAFGLIALPLELPVSTAIILRSLADIGRQEGEDLSDPEAVLACIEVFALGGDREAAQRSAGAVSATAIGESSYFAVRTLLAKSVSEAAKYMVQRGIADETAPVLVRLLGQVASRFGLVVTQKMLAQSVPVIGAVTGASINAAFMDHYQRLARAHFTVRRLERRYGAGTVRAAYERLDVAIDKSPVPPGPARVTAALMRNTNQDAAPGRVSQVSDI